MDVIGHDAVTEDWMIAVESQDFVSSDHRHFRAFQPASSVGRANGQRDDVVLAFEDLFRKVMLLSTLHAGIVHCTGRARKDPPTTGFLNGMRAGPKGPAYGIPGTSGPPGIAFGEPVVGGSFRARPRI